MNGVEYTEIAPGAELSRVIKGCWQLAGGHGDVDVRAAIEDMEAFLDAGITTLDCADIYTGVEEMIGGFISDVRSRRGASVANKIRVHTKLVPDLGTLETLTDADVEAIVDRSLRRLNVERLDLVQFYWWDTSLGNAVRSLDVLKRCQEKGKIAHLGVTNWDIEDTARFLEAGFDIVSTQVQYSLLDRRPSVSLAPWCADKGIGLFCYGTLAGGFLTEKWLGVPDPGFSFENRSLVKYRLIIDEYGSWDDFQSLLSVLHEISRRHDVSLSAVATRWVLDQPQVSAAIVGARYARHLPKTLDVFRTALTPSDHQQIASQLLRHKGVAGPVYGVERDRAGRHGRIMKYNLNTVEPQQVG